MTTRLTALLLPALLLLAAVLAMGSPAHAAQGQDGCAGFIDSLPATITTQGVWCLRKHVSTAQTSGAAILVGANNVTIDCNDFKLGGLAAGEGSSALGIQASSQANLTVRNCNIRGFQRGIDVSGGSGHLVEDNRFDNNLLAGIQLVSVGNSLVRGNRVFDTGGWVGNAHLYGIRCSVEGASSCDVLDNAIDGIFSVEGSVYSLRGILVGGVGSRVAGNSVRGLLPGSADVAWGVISSDGPTFVDGNEITLPTGAAGAYGFSCAQAGAALRGNTTWNTSAAPSVACADDGGNAAH